MTSLAHCPRLLADVGGTNVRFAIQTNAFAPISDVREFQCARFDSLEIAIRHYLSLFKRSRPKLAVIAIANPVHGDLIKMTNLPWSFSTRELQLSLGLRRLEVLNDFTALALSLPLLPKSALRPLGQGKPLHGFPIGLIGPGTGLGVSGLVPDGAGGWIPLHSEGGHVTLPSITARERLVVEGLADRYHHASAERAICGQGLLDIFSLLCSSGRKDAPEVTHPSQITSLAHEGHPLALESIQLLTAFLGLVAGNLALTLGARGGVYIGGGIVPKLGELFDPVLFRKRFESKGRFAAYLENIPTWVISCTESPALSGAAQVANRWQ